MNDTDQEQDGEEGEDERDLAIRFWSNLVSVAISGRMVYIEGFTCSKCNARQFAAHTGAEIVACCKCNHSNASATPRPKVPGELQPAHYEMAMNALYGISKDRQASGLPPATNSELAELSPAERLMIARVAEQTRKATLERVMGLAKELAKLEG